MKKERMHYLIVLDKSGSMEAMKNTVINSFNEQLQSLKKSTANKEINVTMAIFNDSTEILNLNVGVNKVKELSEENYQPDSLTALYDAIMIGYNSMKKQVKRKERVVVLVLTDGMENASKEYGENDVRTLIKKIKKRGGEFNFLCSGFDVGNYEDSIGVSDACIMSFENGDFETDLKEKLSQISLSITD